MYLLSFLSCVCKCMPSPAQIHKFRHPWPSANLGDVLGAHPQAWTAPSSKKGGKRKAEDSSGAYIFLIVQRAGARKYKTCHLDLHPNTCENIKYINNHPREAAAQFLRCPLFLDGEAGLRCWDSRSTWRWLPARRERVQSWGHCTHSRMLFLSIPTN